MMVAAVEHGTGLVPGQVQVGDKTNGIPAVRELTRALGLKGRVVTLDAMHAQHETARALVEDCGADYVVTAVKDNQPTMFDDLRAIDWHGARRVDGGWEEAHDRLERRSCAVLDIGGPEWDGYGDLHGRRQAFRIERERRLVKQGAGSRETAYGLTSLGAGQAGPEELAALVRRHWHIENRLHYVRDFTYDEDRCRVRVGNPPRNLACLTNAAIPSCATRAASPTCPPPTGTTPPDRRRPSTPSRPRRPAERRVPPKAPAPVRDTGQTTASAGRQDAPHPPRHARQPPTTPNKTDRHPPPVSRTRPTPRRIRRPSEKSGLLNRPAQIAGAVGCGHAHTCRGVCSTDGKLRLQYDRGNPSTCSVT